MKKGFTLIELMVVIVIIGILAAIAVPKMFNMSAKAKIAEAPETLSAYERLQQTYMVEKGELGNSTSIAYQAPNSNFFNYYEGLGGVSTSVVYSAAPQGTYGDCSSASVWLTNISAKTTVAPTHTSPSGACGAYTPNWN